MQIDHQYYDTIVDGYNQNYLNICYDSAMRKEGHYALFYMNIKNFRYYHSTYGFEGSNQLLRLIYQKLVECFHEIGDIVHLYADHFAFLVCYEHIDTLIYTTWMDALDKLYRIDDSRIYRELFMSFGVYELDKEHPIDFHQALNYANIARKSCGSLFKRTSCLEVCDKERLSTYIDYHELEIKTAEAYKEYKFIAYLQPKVDAQTHEIVGAEALLRWKDENGAYIPVYQFLPILNENSYISLVDLDVFEMVCKLLQENLDSGKKVVPVSFNISKSTFYDPNIMTDYLKIFNQFTIPKELIEFELMESISLDDTKRLKEVVSLFKEHGFRCSLDDFGNGYSSFNVLLNAELYAVKMDRQFFLDNLNGDSKLIIETIVHMIKSLHMKVVAEGVESKEHVDFLAQCGCDMIQGFYFYKPMPLDEFNEILQNKK